MSDGAEALLIELGRTDGTILPLAEGALAFARLERPEVDPEGYRAHLDQLADELAAELGGVSAPPLRDRVAALVQVMVGNHGYQGDGATYDDLANADLMRVIDRRRGLPVALGILYIHAARAQGWRAGGLNFPGHFLIRIDAGGEQAILDPFAGGEPRNAAQLRRLLQMLGGGEAPDELAPEHYRMVADRDVLLRLQNNIKLRLLQAGKSEAAFEVLRRMRLVAPRHADLWRETGMLANHLGRLTAGIAALETALSLDPAAEWRHEAAQLLQQLKGRLN
ncbi:MAG TPA: transglutaminase-like domain-containing protein [Aliidongia sp.]|nr:transglutaminase-like domain-containing protein [Aliidongia sp.]